jgi:FlaG/FlaF family flagellin (archaellin)
LLVAITVIMASVVATFVFGISERVGETAPGAGFSFAYDGGDTSTDNCGTNTFGDGSGEEGAVTVTHNGGDSLETARLTLHDGEGNRQAWSDCTSGYTPPTKLTAGDQIVVQMDADDTLQVVWTNAQGTDSATLGRYPGPGV